MKKFLNLIQCALILVLGTSFFSCTTNAIIEVDEDSSGVFTFETGASESVEGIIRSFTGADQSVNVFDKALIENSFKKADLTLLSFDTTGNASIAISGSTKNINTLVPGGEQLIIFKNSNTDGELSLHINTATMASLFSLLGQENLIYLDLLQAPIFTGFEMTTEEYLSFIGALYGQTMLEELETSNITFILSVPNKIKGADLKPSNVGDISFIDNEAVVSISLTDFLANTSEITLNITW